MLRGLGYWFFYGASNQTGNWTQAAVAYTQQLWLFGPDLPRPQPWPSLAGAFLRWRKRAYFIVLVVVGMVLAVGPYPVLPRRPASAR